MLRLRNCRLPACPDAYWWCFLRDYKSKDLKIALPNEIRLVANNRFLLVDRYFKKREEFQYIFQETPFPVSFYSVRH